MEVSTNKKKCSGFCQKEFDQDQMTFLAGHEEHSVCLKCFCSWVLKCFYENPLAFVRCPGCAAGEGMWFYSLDWVRGQYIPEQFFDFYKDHFIRASYSSCFVCENFFENSKIYCLGCGHKICEKDYVELILNYYKSLVKGGNYLGESVGFQIICKCGNFLNKEPPNVQNFNNLALKLDTYFGIRQFYDKYSKFFLGQNELNYKSCCKKYTLSDVCLKCSLCAKCSSPIHLNMTCEDLKNLKNTYSIDLNEPLLSVPPIYQELIIPSFKSIFKISNPRKQVAFEFKRVWVYGFIPVPSRSEISLIFENPPLESEKMQNPSHSSVIFCEISGSALCEYSDINSEMKSPIYWTESKFIIPSESQLRLIYLIEY